MMEQEAWASVDDVAAHLRSREGTVYRRIESKGSLPHKVGRLWELKRLQGDARTETGGASGDEPKEES